MPRLPINHNHISVVFFWNIIGSIAFGHIFAYLCHISVGYIPEVCSLGIAPNLCNANSEKTQPPHGSWPTTSRRLTKIEFLFFGCAVQQSAGGGPLPIAKEGASRELRARGAAEARLA